MHYSFPRATLNKYFADLFRALSATTPNAQALTQLSAGAFPITNGGFDLFVSDSVTNTYIHSRLTVS